MNKINFYQKGFAMPILLGIIALLIIAGGGTYLYLNKKAIEPVTENKEEKINIKNEDINKQATISSTSTPLEIKFKKFIKEKYSFEAPENWTESSVVLSDSDKSNGCELYSISYGGDGHRMGGEISIYTNSCFKTLILSGPMKENTEIAGYHIVAYYSRESGTTPSEESVTKEAYKKVVETFVLNTKEISVKIFLSNRIFNPKMLDCNLVYPITRIIPETQAVATAALTELIKGPTPEEEKAGYVAVISEGTKINSIKIVNGIIFIDFNKNIENNFTSCSGATRLSAMEKTLLQFPTIKEIRYSVEGNSNPNEILQP